MKLSLLETNRNRFMNRNNGIQYSYCYKNKDKIKMGILVSRIIFEYTELMNK